VVDRYVRQAKLVEVGAAGQARIVRAVVDVRLEGAAADIAARYLGGAGVAGVRVRDAAIASGARTLAPSLRVEVDPLLAPEPPEQEEDAFDLRDPACRDLVRGACAALRALRAALAVDDPAPGVSS
jgi:hypothetical protein